MRKLLLPVVSLLAVGSVSAQQELSFLQPVSPIFNDLAGALFGGSYVGTQWASVAAMWVALGSLIYVFLSRFNLPKWSKVTLSIIAGYFILNNNTVMGTASGFSITTVPIILISTIGLFYLLSKVTISERTRERLAEGTQRRKSRKEKKRELLNEKLNSMEKFLQTHEDTLLKHENNLEDAEREKNRDVINDINQLLETISIEEQVSKEVKKIESLARSVKDPMAAANIQARLQQYSNRINELRRKTSALLERLSRDENQEQSEESQEGAEIKQEKADVKNERKNEKTGKRNIKKNLRDEKKEENLKHLPLEDKQKAVMKESEERMELSVEEKKRTLINEKRKYERQKAGKASAISKLNSKIPSINAKLWNKSLLFSERKKLLEEIKMLEEKKKQYHQEIQNINPQIARINSQLEKLEDEETQIEQKEIRNIAA